MRYFDRSVVTAPASLTTKNGVGEKEIEKARVHYSGPHDKSYPFKAYQSADVKEALKALFHGKCAYCESRITAVGPIDVEHYRPKGRVECEDDHPGYWWLAAKWENLLPSCIYCNRPNNLEVLSTELGEEATITYTTLGSGKKDLFPISGTRAYSEAENLDEEKPLLIDPTQDAPESLLLWPVNYNLGIVTPVTDEGHLNLKAVTSIKVFGLNRRCLVEERTKLLLSLKSKRDQIIGILDTAVTCDDPAQGQLIQIAVSMLNELRECAGPSHPYSALANSFCDETITDLARRYTAIIAV